MDAFVPSSLTHDGWALSPAVPLRERTRLNPYVVSFCPATRRSAFPQMAQTRVVVNAFRSLLGIGTNGEGPTYDGLYEGTWKHPTMASHHD